MVVRGSLYEVLEQDLKELPEISRAVIEKMGVIRIVPTDQTLERREFEENDSLRSPRYTYNLLERIGPKHCVMCECGIPELIHGAHVWPVASIKKEGGLTFEEKLRYATDGHNGLWLCENHHKLFDENIITISKKGKVEHKSGILSEHKSFIHHITTNTTIPDHILTDQFLEYLWKRNKAIAV